MKGFACPEHYSNGLLQFDERPAACGKYSTPITFLLSHFFRDRDLVAQIHRLSFGRGMAASGA